MVSYFGVYELLGQFVYRIYSNNIDFYHVKGDFTEVHFLWFLEDCAVVAAKTITFALILNQQLAALQSIRLNFKKKYTYSRPRGDFGTFFSTQQLKLK